MDSCSYVRWASGTAAFGVTREGALAETLRKRYDALLFPVVPRFRLPVSNWRMLQLKTDPRPNVIA
jgi:hypothetical protein